MESNTKKKKKTESQDESRFTTQTETTNWKSPVLKSPDESLDPTAGLFGQDLAQLHSPLVEGVDVQKPTFPVSWS